MHTLLMDVMHRIVTGKVYDLEGEGLLARAICHECDHLDGKLYTDCLVKEK